MEAAASTPNSKVFKLVSINGSGNTKEIEDFNIHEENIQSLFNHSGFQDKPAVILTILASSETAAVKSNLLLQLANYIANENEIGTILLNEVTIDLGDNDGVSSIITRVEPVLVQETPFSQFAIFMLEISGKDTSEKLTRFCTHLSSNVILITSGTVKEKDFEWIKSSRRLISSSQQLSIIVLDWNHPEEFLLGRQGGGKLLDKFLQGQPEIKRLLNKQFDQLLCFLMPPETHDRFAISFEQFLAQMVGRIYLTPKKINGNVVTCGQIPNLIESYVSACGLTEPENELNLNEEILDMPDFTKEENETKNLVGLDSISSIMDELILEPTNSAQMSLEEYLEQNAQKSTKPDMDSPVFHLSENPTPKTPEEILQKYSSPKQVSNLHIPTTPTLANISEKIKSEENRTNEMSDDVLRPLAREEFLSTDCYPFNTSDQLFNREEPASIEDDTEIVPTQGISEVDSTPAKYVPKAEFEKVLLEKIVENFSKTPIFYSGSQIQSKCYQRSIGETRAVFHNEEKEVEIFEDNSPQEILSKSCHFWSLYDAEIRKTISSKGPEESKSDMLSLCISYCKRSKELNEPMGTILAEKFMKIHKHEFNELEIKIQGMEYAIDLAIKYYKIEMSKSPELQKQNEKKVLEGGKSACNFPNTAWEQYFTRKLSERLDQLNEEIQQQQRVSKISEIILAPTPEDTDTMKMACASSLQAYEDEMERTLKFHISPDIFVVDEAHEIAKSTSIKKFQTYMSSYNTDWTTKYKNEVLAGIEEKYSDFLRKADLKRQEHEERSRSRKIIPVEKPASSIASSYFGNSPLHLSGFCGIHVTQRSITVGVLGRPNCSVPNKSLIIPAIGPAKKEMEKNLNMGLDSCVITIPANLEMSDAKAIKEVATSGAAFQNAHIIYETCAAVVFSLKRSEISFKNLIVINCGENVWTVAKYQLKNKDQRVHLIGRLSCDQATCANKDAKINRENVEKLIQDVGNKLNLKEIEILLVGGESLIVKLKGALGIIKYGKVHLITAENILEGAVLYAAEKFGEKGHNALEVCIEDEIFCKIVTSETKRWYQFSWPKLPWSK